MNRHLGFWGASAIIVGTMIGSGIFIVPSSLANWVSSSGLYLGLWIICGVLNLMGAFAYGELAALYPEAGGQYVFLRKAFGPFFSFLYGWSFFVVIQSGLAAAVSIAFAKYLGVIFPKVGETNVLWKMGFLSINTAQIVASLVIVLLTYINTRGVASGSRLQNIFTLIKVLAVVVLIVAGFSYGSGHFSHFTPIVSKAVPSWNQEALEMGFIAAFVMGASKVLFAYDGWNNGTFIASEIKNPQRNLPLALTLGTLVVIVLYTLMSAVCLYMFSLDNMALIKENRVAAAIVKIWFGPVGAIIIAVVIMISTFSTTNGLLLAGSRVLYAMAKDNLFFPKAATLNKNKVPESALWILCAWSILLACSGSFDALLTYTMFAALLFNALTVLSVFVLRIKQPTLYRPYRTFGYPVTPFLFILGSLFFVVYLFIGNPINSLYGLGIILLGLPVYVWMRRKSNKNS